MTIVVMEVNGAPAGCLAGGPSVIVSSFLTTTTTGLLGLLDLITGH